MTPNCYKCIVKKVQALTPSVIRIVFVPECPFVYEPGQFVYLVIPPSLRQRNLDKRCYSLSTSFEHAKQNGYELCIKLRANGHGSTYVRWLSPGDPIQIVAPDGDFTLRKNRFARNICLIGTGTGVAPLRSILQANRFKELGTQRVTLIEGVRFEQDLLFQDEFKRMGIHTHFVVSRPGPQWEGERGHVTDVLRKLGLSSAFSETDFYICGNGNMVHEVEMLLRTRYQVSPKAIFREHFSPLVLKMAS